MKQRPNHQIEATFGSTRTWIGIGLLLLSALGFTVNMLFANMAYKDGIDVHTTNAVRYFVTIVLLFLFQKIRGKHLKLPARERYTSLALGISVFMMGVGYLGATQYIPVSLAVLIFYTAPLFVAAMARFTENEPITIIRLIAIIIAFIGLALALEIQSVANYNWLGVGFGFLSSIGCTTFIIISSLSMRTVDSQAVNFHSLTAGTALFAAFLLFIGGPEVVITNSALLELSVSSLALTIGYVTLFAGLDIVGPVRASMLLNAEPILTIILAAILLGERLSSFQLLGAGLVIAGIVLITYDSRNVNHN